MQLKLAIHRITGIRFGSRTSLDGTTLVVDTEELRRLLLEDPSLLGVDFEIVRPGERCRAGPVFDIIEPRAKEPDSSPDFPGILGPPQTAGMGTTHVLEGAAVTVLKETGAGDSRGAPGYVLEMSGGAAAGTKYASLHHLIVIPRTKPGLPVHAQQKAYRLAGLKTAVHTARATMNETPVSTNTFEFVGPGAGNREGLPRVAYIGQIFSRQRKPELGEQILYGADTDGMLPVLLHPDEWLD
jgi:sarcosine reductase